jgi:SynChlorMet cassette protein ScmC
MSIESEIAVSCMSIRLMNGQQWRFRPTDTGSEDVIRRMANVMKLSSSSSGKELFVTVQESKREDRSQVPGRNPLICILPPGTNDAMQAIQMMDLAKAIALETIPAGGLLIHGALAERDGMGVLLAAPGGTGKTTASSRLRLPWHSLSDDATLVVRDGSGNYFAHPWPTWSRFFDNGPGGCWEVERAVPLAAIFFLIQSPEEHAEPMNTGNASAYLMESVHQIMGTPALMGCTPVEFESLCTMELATVSTLVKEIPAYLLHISLTGRFWDEIALVLAQRAVNGHAETREKPFKPAKKFYQSGLPEPAIDLFGAGHIPIVYSGPSMNPTLQAPDLLDVVPYDGGQPAVGDVICFIPPGDEKIVVHRIIRITGSGIQTQGDNNPSADTALFQENRIIGRVIGATRGNHPKRIASGNLGRFTRWRMRTRKYAIINIFRVIRLAKPALVLTRASSHLLPGSWKPRIVLFSSRNTQILRLFFGASVAGEFNTTRGIWTIRFPFRLLVNETALPTLERPLPAYLQDIARQPLNSPR